jgi:hypothetical protein
VSECHTQRNILTAPKGALGCSVQGQDSAQQNAQTNRSTNSGPSCPRACRGYLCSVNTG